MQLYNKLSAKERAALIDEAGTDRLTISFYQYATIGNPQVFRDTLFIKCESIDVLGRIYVAHEGINAQLSLPADKFKDFKEHLDTITFLEGIRLNVAREQDNKSFLKLKIKVKDKIVADGLDDDTFDPTDIGVHLKAQGFNDILDDPDTVLIDMRNHYETEIGHFKNAITPDVDTFRESLPIIEDDLKDHKEGGIIEYARQIDAEGLENKFIGKNFVFDERRGERISEDIISNCHQCGNPCDTHTNCGNVACNLLFLQCEECKEEHANCCGKRCKYVNALTFEEQKELRKGNPNSNKIFNKGRSENISFKK